MLKIQNFMFGSNNEDRRTSHDDKQSNTQANKKASERERRLGKRGQIKRQGWSVWEENERQMENNVNAREMSLWWVLGMSWLERRPPQQWRQKSFLLRLELALVFLEEERVMQQSSVSISLSFWEPRYQSSRRLLKSPMHLHKQTRTRNQRTKGVVNPFAATCESEIW